MKLSEHFKIYSLIERDYLTVEICQKIISNPIKIFVQDDGRIRYWGYVPEFEKYLRVVVENDGETILTAHFDRNFKKKMEDK